MLTFFIDTNRINSRKKCSHMNSLEELSESCKCEILMPRIAWSEAVKGSDEKRKRKTWSYFYIGLEYTKSQNFWYKKIESIIFPTGANTQNQINDVWILVISREMNYPLITNDGDSNSQKGGILGNKLALNKIGINVIRDYEAVEMVLNFENI